MYGAAVRYLLIAGVLVLAVLFLGWLETHRQGGTTGSFGASTRFTGRPNLAACLGLGVKAGYRLGLRLYHQATTDRHREMAMISVAAEAAACTRQQIEDTVDYGNVLMTASASEDEKLAIEARLPEFIEAVRSALQRLEDHQAGVFRTRPCVVDLSDLKVRAHVSSDGRTYAEWSWEGAWRSRSPNRQHSEFVGRLVTDVLGDDDDDGLPPGGARTQLRGPAYTPPPVSTPEDVEAGIEPRVRVTGASASGAFGAAVAGGASSRPLLIGRDQAADLILPSEDLRLSREHARVLVENGEILVVDTSKQGTWLLDADGAKHRLVKDQLTPLPAGVVLALTRDESVTVTFTRLD